MKSYEERIAELDAKREQKEKELAQLKAKQKKLQQQKNALERKARTKRLIETGAIIESVLGRPVDSDDIEPIKQLMEYYKLKKQMVNLFILPSYKVLRLLLNKNRLLRLVTLSESLCNYAAFELLRAKTFSIYNFYICQVHHSEFEIC